MCMSSKGDQLPNCADCMPVLDSKNEGVIEIYNATRAVGMSEIFNVMDMYKVQNKKRCFERVLNLMTELKEDG